MKSLKQSINESFITEAKRITTKDKKIKAEELLEFKAIMSKLTSREKVLSYIKSNKGEVVHDDSNSLTVKTAGDFVAIYAYPSAVLNAPADKIETLKDKAKLDQIKVRWESIKLGRKIELVGTTKIGDHKDVFASIPIDSDGREKFSPEPSYFNVIGQAIPF